MNNEFNSSFNDETFSFGRDNEPESEKPETDGFNDFDDTVPNSQPIDDADDFSEFNPPTESEEEKKADFESAESQTANYHYPSGFKDNSKGPKSKGVKTGIVIVSVLLAAIIGSVASLGVFTYLNKDVLTGKSNGVTNNVPQSEININVDETAENVIEAVAAKVTPSVVGIRTTAAVISFFGGSSESTGEGSGIIYTKDGYIITNYHVIESAATSSSSKISVFLSSNTEKEYEASVVGYNISHDLAVIKISANNLPAIELGDASKLKSGQFVAAIGNPGGLEFMGSVTYGVISGLNRVVPDSSSKTEVNLIQTDAAINPGNSGGALVNIKGQLIGVNSSKIAATDYEGMGFAIPIDTVKDICDRIIVKEYDPNPYIGITLSERYDGETLRELGFPEGAVVKSVNDGGPAYEAGIRTGDIIVEFNGKAISNYNDLYDEIANTTPNSSVKVQIYRSRKYYTTTIKVGSNNSQ
ncbi:MAG: trypsin-like peptidase domain-containing protein [Clostridiales bacterium]|nr:trypsin-like peptidase domain-containing protein [Candidatus Equinaster intestinalis]